MRRRSRWAGRGSDAWHPGALATGASRSCLAARLNLTTEPRPQKMAKRCPKCGMATQKDEGCNKMACGGCGAYWCWRCGKEIDG